MKLIWALEPGGLTPGPEFLTRHKVGVLGGEPGTLRSSLSFLPMVAHHGQLAFADFRSFLRPKKRQRDSS